jgi:hypothetical protein
MLALGTFHFVPRPIQVIMMTHAGMPFETGESKKRRGGDAFSDDFASLIPATCITERGYEIRELVGEGGYGKVYVACKKGSCEYVIKVTRDAWNNTDTDEIRIAIRCGKLGLGPRVFAWWRCKERLSDGVLQTVTFLAMERFHNTLREHLKEDRPFTREDADRVVSLLARLADSGVQQNDMKGDNIMVYYHASGSIARVAVVDFGLAYSMDGDGNEIGEVETSSGWTGEGPDVFEPLWDTFQLWLDQMEIPVFEDPQSYTESYKILVEALFVRLRESVKFERDVPDALPEQSFEEVTSVKSRIVFSTANVRMVFAEPYHQEDPYKRAALGFSIPELRALARPLPV